MTSWLHTTALLAAQHSHWRRLGDGLYRSKSRPEFADFLPYLIFAAVLAAVIAVVVLIIKRNDMSESCNDPQKLFRELSRAHRLGRANRRLLSQLATARKLRQPAEVFLSPAAFELSSLPPQLRSQQPRLEKLRERLF